LANAGQLKPNPFQPIIKIKNVKLYGVILLIGSEIKKSVISNGIIANEKVTISDSTIEDTLVLKISIESGNNVFRNCDFSGADIPSPLDKCTFENCFYHDNQKPSEQTIMWLTPHVEHREGSSKRYF